MDGDERKFREGRDHVLSPKVLECAWGLAGGRCWSMLIPHSPMLRVTVMMFSDMVESVMLLKEEDWKRQKP